MHGWQKLTEMGVEGVSGFLGSLGFPLAGLFAVLLIAGELLAGAGLILGFLTHWAAKVGGFIALVALLTVHLTKGFFVATGGFEFILLILAASIVAMIFGGGKWTLDSMIWKKSIPSAQL